ncbi:MAG: Fic family protein [Muribaculaceae bacterium]|nr:Fic family protein [Muribaculaceae bacterium]
MATHRTQRQILLDTLANYHELGIDKQIDYDKFYLYSLITHSTAIEGSTVTEVENQLLFDEGITAKGRTLQEQMMNLDLKAAYDRCIELATHHVTISVELLKSLAALVMKNTGSSYNTALGSFSSANGDLRKLNVTAGVGGRSYMSFQKVPQRLQEFCEWINLQRDKVNKNDITACYNLSFDAHFRLVTIHPWADGNGRMARLVMHFLQMENNLIPVKVTKDQKSDYIQALIDTRESDDLDVFRNVMQKLHISNMQYEIGMFKQSMNDEKIGDILNDVTNVTNRHNNILQLLKTNEHITTSELAALLHVTKRTVLRDIATLKQSSRLERIGSLRTGRWKVL